MERSPDPHRPRARGSPEDATLLGRGPLRALESVGMLALALDPEGRIVLASEQLLELTGWSREEVLPQDWFGHEPGAGRGPGGLPERFETEIISRSGARRLVSWSTAVLRDEGGRVAGTILLGQEVSEELQRLGAIDARADELAHDIDQLLRTAGSCGESLSAGLDAADPRREDALAIVRAAERASTLARQLLDVSRRRAVQQEGLRVLPPLSVPAAGQAPEQVVAAPGAGPERILLAEDDETIRQLVTEVLTRAGYRVHAAASGDEALALLEEHGASIDLLLTDVVMPGMSGPELARAAQLRRPALRVLYTSGYASEPDEAFEDPGVEFIGKPFSPQALVAKVRDVLGVD